MDSNTFFNHDTDEEIIQKRSSEELNLWISHITYNIDESDKLAKIAAKIIKSTKFSDLFSELTTKNQTVLNQLIGYRNTMVDYKECDDFECDLFYINKHEDYRKQYAETVEEFRKHKTDFYSEILK